MADELLQKKQQMLQSVAVYRDSLEEDNVLRTQQQFTTDQFDAYDQGQMDETTCASFKQSIREMMLVDQTSAVALKDKYGDIWDEAQKEETRLKTDASRSGIGKAIHDITGKKKDAAKKRLNNIDSARDKLVRERVRSMDVTINQEFSDMMKQLDQDIAQATVGQTEEDTYERLDAAEKKRTLEIDENYDSKTEVAEKKAYNARLHAHYDVLRQRYRRFKLKTVEGLCAKKTAMYELSPQESAIKPLMDKFFEAHPEHKGKTDVYRDVCRWICPVGHAYEAKEDDCQAALHQLDTFLALDKTEYAKWTDKESRQSIVSFDFLYEKMTSFADECRAFQAKLPPSFFNGHATYDIILEHNAEFNAFYKKSQGVTKLAKVLRTSNIFKTQPVDKQEEILALNAYLGSMQGFFMDCSVSGGNLMDKAYSSGQPFDYAGIVSLDVRMKMNMDRYRSELSGTNGKK